ncbi:unnamed protein product [Trichobilharzia regenti]|nr:unnamed protein product [Trichobilharzia regenti]
MLDINMSPVDWMMKCYPEIKERDDMRKLLGRYGLSGPQQVSFYEVFTSKLYMQFITICRCCCCC